MWHRFSKKKKKKITVGSGFAAHLFMEFAAHWWKVGSTAPEWSLQQRPLYNYLKQNNLADDIHSSSCLSRGSITEKLQSRLQRLASSVSIINWKSSGLFLQHCTQITPTYHNILGKPIDWFVQFIIIDDTLMFVCEWDWLLPAWRVCPSMGGYRVPNGKIHPYILYIHTTQNYIHTYILGLVDLWE